ncbi:Protein PQN-35 b [Aphelenchoides avenae]|nr:Protein PQN-35 b [Aphelenchus avenae]
MKVFTVGLDQKPPVKSPDSPPPGYPSPTPPAGIKMPLPLGPEVAPVIVKKSRGYKGILMVMLAVFLMALFALTLSEIAYNRQRDENFFRLRWAELKHRMGYPEPPNYEYYRRLDANRIYELNRNKELAEPLVQQPQETSTSTVAPPQPEQMVIDSESRQQSGSQEQDQGGSLARDARLQFLRTILQKIKQHAEAMGLEGTMQVSVIEVDPEQLSAENARQPGGKPQPRLPFMPHDPKSDSFLDGFGEYHQPTFMENNQIAEQNRQRAFGPWPREQESSQDVDFPGRHGPYRPDEMSFRPFRPEWAMPPRPFGGEHNEVEQPPMPPMNLGPIVEPPMPQQKVFELERPQEIVGEMYGRKFGRMLQDLIASRLQGMQQMQLNPLMPQRPSFPIENSIVQQQAQQQGPPMMPPNTWWQQPPPQWQRPIGQGVDFFPQPPQNQQQQPQGGPQQQQQMPQVVFFPPPPPPVQPQQMQQQSQEQQPQQVPQQAQQFPQPQNLIPPEDRIQIEPPNQGGPKIQGVIAPEFRPWPEAANAEPKQPKEEKMGNEGPRGWTHQEQVDFPAVKLPLPAMNDGEANHPQEQPDAVVNEPHAEAPPMQPHEQQHDSPMVQPNPIFFQVDEPQPFAAAKA